MDYRQRSMGPRPYERMVQLGRLSQGSELQWPLRGVDGNIDEHGAPQAEWLSPRLSVDSVVHS